MEREHLRVIADDFNVNRREHAALLSIRNAQLDADVRLQSHASPLEAGVEGQVDGVVAFAGVIVVDDGTVVGNFMAGRPPPYDVFVWVDAFVQFVDVFRIAQFGFDELVVFLVRDTEAVCHLYDALVRRS